MKIGVLTSSRADYGIYLHLLTSLKEDDFFNLEIIAFGTHLSKFHGYTINDIFKGGYNKIHEISALLSNDNEQSIATSYGLTVLKFSDFWGFNKYDLVLCLGDRFEMSAAVQAGIPYRVRFAHIHGGETTLGAIDNVYRHQISLASSIHFTTTEEYKNKVIDITGIDKNVYDVGSLSLDNIDNFKPIEKEIFYNNFDLNSKPFALVTFHPETVSVAKNALYCLEMKNGLSKLTSTINLVITMPNADTLGTLYRKAILELKEEYPKKVVLIENFGKDNYFSAMHYSELLLGNTSSGIIEAASFGKYVINVGDRQKGRMQSKNTFNVKYNSEEIYNKVNEIITLDKYCGDNVYFKNNACENIISTLKNLDEKI